MESNLGRLEIKFHMVGMEWLDLNTRVGGSLLRKCVIEVVVLSDGSPHELRVGVQPCV